MVALEGNSLVAETSRLIDGTNCLGDEAAGVVYECFCLMRNWKRLMDESKRLTRETERPTLEPRRLTFEADCLTYDPNWLKDEAKSLTHGVDGLVSDQGGLIVTSKPLNRRAVVGRWGMA